MVHLFVLGLLIQFRKDILHCIEVLLHLILAFFVRENITGAHTETMDNDPVMNDLLRLREESSRCFRGIVQPNGVNHTTRRVAYSAFIQHSA